MSGKWLLFKRDTDEKEIIVNSANIWKIEVTYGVPSPQNPRMLCDTSLKEGRENPNAVRWYKVFVGAEVLNLPGTPGSEALKVIEEIYKQALPS